MAPWQAKRLKPLWFSHYRQTNGHITMRWSANVGTTSKTAFTAFGIPFPPCKGKRLVNVIGKTMRNTRRHVVLCAFCQWNVYCITLKLLIECNGFKCSYELISFCWFPWCFKLDFKLEGVNYKCNENWELSRSRLIDVIHVQFGARKPLQGEMRFLFPLVCLVSKIESSRV